MCARFRVDTAPPVCTAYERRLEGLTPVSGPVTVRELLPSLTKWGAQLIAGESGLGAAVSWASLMRAQPPAFQDVHRDEVVLLSLATVQALADRGASVSRKGGEDFIRITYAASRERLQEAGDRMRAALT